MRGQLGVSVLGKGVTIQDPVKICKSASSHLLLPTVTQISKNQEENQVKGIRNWEQRVQAICCF